MLEFLLQLLHFFLPGNATHTHKGKAGGKIASMLNSCLASGERESERATRRTRVQLGSHTHC